MSRPRLVLISLNLILLIIIISQVIFYLVIFPKITLTNINIKTDLKLNDKSILDLLELDSLTNFYSFNSKKMEKKLNNYNIIERVSINKQFPHTINITIEKRKPLLSIILEKNNSNQVATIDKNGIIYQISSSHLDNTPILSGISLSNVKVNSRTPDILHPLLNDLFNLQQNYPDLYNIISELSINITSYRIITDITLTSYKTKIRVGKYLTPKTIKTSLIVLEVLKKGHIDTNLVDMRTTSLVYRVNNDRE